MSLQIGIVGLPNVGKSTLFNALSNSSVPAANYPFCTIEPNVGVVPIEDKRLEVIGQITKPDLLTGATIEFVDIAGLVKGASQGEGLGNQFLGHIRQVDAILHVVRAFEDENVIANYPGIDPLRDAEIVETELILADIQILENRLDKTTKMFKTGDAKYRAEAKMLEDALKVLAEGKPLRSAKLPLPSDLFPLTNKPMLYVANVDETNAQELISVLKEKLAPLQAKAAAAGSYVLPISAALESEITQLEPAERQLFLDELGLATPGLQLVAQAGLELLDLITFYTVKGKETRAWLVSQGTLAPKAAGKIHTDMERGFIRAEVTPWNKLIELGSFSLCREKGVLRVEGKDYPIADGDVVQFRFNV